MTPEPLEPLLHENLIGVRLLDLSMFSTAVFNGAHPDRHETFVQLWVRSSNPTHTQNVKRTKLEQV